MNITISFKGLGYTAKEITIWKKYLSGEITEDGCRDMLAKNDGVGARANSDRIRGAFTYGLNAIIANSIAKGK